MAEQRKLDDECVVVKVFQAKFEANPRNPWNPQNWRRDPSRRRIIAKIKSSNLLLTLIDKAIEFVIEHDSTETKSNKKDIIYRLDQICEL